MAQDRVAFIPWNTSQAGNFTKEYATNQNIGKLAHHKREWTVVYLDSPGTPLADMGFGFGTRLHIAGHGDVGDPKLYADHGTGGGTLSVAQVVDAMLLKGLKKHYIGTIVCDVCSSALGSPSFAKLLARELWNRGIKASCVLGYKGSLYAEYAKWADPNKKAGKYRHREVELPDGTGVKSSDAQERFFGWN